MDVFWSIVLILIVFPAFFMLFRAAKFALLGPPARLHSVALADEWEQNVSRTRARRLRTLRYADEHGEWNAEYAALVGGCPHCSVQALRLELRKQHHQHK